MQNTQAENTSIPNPSVTSNSLLASNQAFRSFFKLTSDAIVLIDGQIVVECNAAALKFFSCGSKTELCGKTLLDFSPQFQPDGELSAIVAEKYMQTALQTGNCQFEWLHQNLDGAKIGAEILLTAGEIQGKPIFQAVVRMVKLKTFDVIQQTQFLESIWNGVDYGIYVLDVLNNGDDFRFVAFNPIIAKDAAIPAEYMLGKTIKEALPLNIAKRSCQYYRECFQTGNSVTFEEHTQVSNQETWLQLTATPLTNNKLIPQIVVTAVDITERKATEEALRDSEEIFRSLVSSIQERKEIEAQLRISEQRFRDVSEAAGEYVWEIDGNGIYTFVTDKAKLVKGYEPAQLLAHSPFEFMPEEDVEHVRAILENAILNKSNFKLEHRDLTASGAIFWEEVSGIPLLDSQGEIIGFRGTGISITERKLVEAALAESEAKFRLLVEGINDNIFSASVDGIFTYISPNFTEMFGYEISEFLEKSFMSLVHPEDVTLCLEASQKMLATAGSKSIVEFRCHKKDGNIIWVTTNTSPIKNKDGVIVGFQGVTRDITERKLVEENLRKSEALLRKQAQREKLLNQLASQIRSSLDFDIILTTAVQEIQNLLQIDRCLYNVYNKENEEPYWEVLKESHYPEIPDLIGCYPISNVGFLLENLQKGEDLWIDNVDTLTNPIFQVFLHSLGIKSLLLIPMRISDEVMGTIVCCHRDIRPWSQDEVDLLYAIVQQLAVALTQAQLYNQSRTKTQELEQTLQELQRTQSQLVQSEKMSSLGQLVAGVAHEINNPVNFIHANLTPARDYIQDLLNLIELYQQYYPEPQSEIKAEIEAIDLDFVMEDLPKLLESMKVGTQRIREIVLSLRTFSRLDEAEFKDANIHEGIDSTLLILQHRLKAKENRPAIEVIKEYGDLPLVECYAGQLNQVFMNILVNAIDALDERDDKRTFAENQENPSAIHIRTELVLENQVKISIKDNAEGIPESIRQRLFDPFFTTKPVGKGTGMGLSISYQIITERHGGQLQCFSVPGEGTEFVILLPRYYEMS